MLQENELHQKFIILKYSLRNEMFPITISNLNFALMLIGTAALTIAGLQE